MSTTIRIHDGLYVTRYCGAGDGSGPHRVRLRIDGNGGSVADLTIRDAMKVISALATLSTEAITTAYQSYSADVSD